MKKKPYGQKKFNTLFGVTKLVPYTIVKGYDELRLSIKSIDCMVLIDFLKFQVRTHQQLHLHQMFITIRKFT